MRQNTAAVTPENTKVPNVCKRRILIDNNTYTITAVSANSTAISVTQTQLKDNLSIPAAISSSHSFNIVNDSSISANAIDNRGSGSSSIYILYDSV